MSKKIQVRIFPDGRIVAETKGIKGEKCTDYIGLIEKLLNAETIESTYTEEFYQTEDLKLTETEQTRLKNKQSKINR